MPSQENVVQGAIVAALEVYADRHWMATDVFEPYANQQGARHNQYCADVVARLGRSRLILLEVKELDWIKRNVSGRLPAYSSVQHQADWVFELQDLPIYYAYASVDSLSYLGISRERQWPNTTLNNVHLSPPSGLFAGLVQHKNAEPDLRAHTTLLHWILAEPAADGLAAKVMAHMLSTRARQLRNKILLAATTTSGGVQLSAWPADMVQQVMVYAYQRAMRRWNANRPLGPDGLNPELADQILRQVRTELAQGEGARELLDQVHQAYQERLRGGPELPKTPLEQDAEARIAELIKDRDPLRAPKKNPDLER